MAPFTSTPWKPEVLDRALQFVGRRVGRQQRQVREAAVAGGVAGAGLGQCVVVGARQVDARLARHEVGARAGDRQHLHGDAAGVHVRQARGAESASSVRLVVCAQTKSGPGKPRRAIASGEMPATMRGTV